MPSVRRNGEEYVGGRRTVGGRSRLSTVSASATVPTLRDDGQIVVRLDAPAVFVDAYTRPVVGFDPTDLSARLGCNVTVVNQWVRPTRIGGWHAASGLPKSQDVALIPGSTALLATDVPVSLDRLVAVAADGVGLRRAEGFGSVTINPTAWTPPITTDAPSHGGSVPEAVEVHRRLGQQVRDRDLRLWLIGLLKERVVDLEHGRVTSRSDYEALRRLRTEDPTTVEAVLDYLSIEDPPVLRDLIALLDDPEGQR